MTGGLKNQKTMVDGRVNVVLIDNLDSFTFNLVHCLEKAGANVEIFRNTEEALSRAQLSLATADAWVIGPGPGSPQDYPQLMAFLGEWIGVKPLLGICLGQQAVAIHYGWELDLAQRPMHGKVSNVEHSGEGLFTGIENPVAVGRYHSLLVSQKSAPMKLGEIHSKLKVEGLCNGEVMAISCFHDRVFATQFHPESVLTPKGQEMIDNWVQVLSLNIH